LYWEPFFKGRYLGEITQGLFEQVKQNPWGVSPDSFVFWTKYHSDKPMQPYLFVDGLREALIQIGFTKDEAEKYLFHVWRHFFTSYMIRKIGYSFMAIKRSC
jgi:hypothetical protein